MKRTLLVLLFSTAIALGGDSLEQQLAKRSLLLRHPSADQTLSQALAALSTDYQTRYHEPLRIFIAVELAQPPDTKPPQPPAPPPKIPGLEPLPDSDPSAARIDTGPIRAPVVELLRYLTSLANVAFTVRGDIILIHAKPK